MLDPMPDESTHAYRQKLERSATQIRRINNMKLLTNKSRQKMSFSKLIYLSMLTMLFIIIVGFAVWQGLNL